MLLNMKTEIIEDAYKNNWTIRIVPEIFTRYLAIAVTDAIKICDDLHNVTFNLWNRFGLHGTHVQFAIEVMKTS